MGEPVSLGYRFLRGFARFWIRRFFRSIHIFGTQNITKGPALFAMNHPNNLIDTLMISYAVERKIHYLATSQMFRNKILALFLHNAGVIPVYRKQDDLEYGQKNVATFQACYDVLEQGEAIGIYPEGTTHAEPRIKKIKTGTARIALETEKQFHNGVKIVPIGLNFSVRKSFRGEVTINIGKPLEMSAYLPAYEHDPVPAVEQLTNDLQNALEAQIVHIEAPELDRLVSDIEEIYQGVLIRDLIEIGLSPHEVDAFRLSKKLVEGIQFFNQRDPARVLHVRQEVGNYKDKLRRVHLQDSLLQKIMENPVSFRGFLLRILFLLFGLPWALWGGVNHFLPYQISRWVSRKIAKRETDYATVRILCGMILYPLFYTAQIYWVRSRVGWPVALAYGGTLPMFGAFAYYYGEKFEAFRGDLKLFLVMLTRRQLLNQLKRRRERLIAEIDRAKEDYLHAATQT